MGENMLSRAEHPDRHHLLIDGSSSLTTPFNASRRGVQTPVGTSCTTGPPSAGQSSYHPNVVCQRQDPSLPRNASPYLPITLISRQGDSNIPDCYWFTGQSQPTPSLTRASQAYGPCFITDMPIEILLTSMTLVLPPQDFLPLFSGVLIYPVRPAFHEVATTR